MKNKIKFFAWAMLFFPLCLFAQKATDQKKYSVNIIWHPTDTREEIDYYVPVYYDNDDHPIKHGPLKINHKRNVPGFTFSYIVSGNIVNGIMNGPLLLEQSAIVPSLQASMKLKVTANFINGIPNGKWIFSKIGSAKKESESETCSIIFDKNGRLKAYDSDDFKFKINDDNSFSGKLDGYNYVNNVNTSVFVRKTGEITSLGEKEQKIINQIISEEITLINDLIAEGYIIDLEGFGVSDNLDIEEYFEHLSIDYLTEGCLTVSFRDSIYATARSLPRLILKRVNTLSPEQLVDHAKYMVEIAEKVKIQDNQMVWHGVNGGKYTYLRDDNKIYINSNIYYFTDEAKIKLEEIITQLLAEKERIAEEARIAAEEAEKKRVLQNVEEGLKKLVKVSNPKEMKFWGAGVVLTSDYSSNPREWQQYFSTTEALLKEKLAPFCPVLHYKILDIEKIEDYYLVKCVIDKFINKQEGYISYQTEISTSNGLIDMSKSFDFTQAKKVENDWDRIHALKSQIATNKDKILANKDNFLTDVVSAYAKYHKTCNLEIGDNTSDAINRFNEIIEVQNQCFEFIELRKQIHANDVNLLDNVQCKNIVKFYSTYFESFDLSWSIAENAKDKLLEVIKTQEELKQNLFSEYAITWENAIIVEQIKDFNSALQCFETIDLRKQCNDNDIVIQKYAQQYKNIVKIYVAYFKKLDFTWQSANTSKSQFEEIIAIQNIILNAIKSANAAELEIAVKKEKIKDIHTLVNTLK